MTVFKRFFDSFWVNSFAPLCFGFFIGYIISNHDIYKKETTQKVNQQNSVQVSKIEEVEQKQISTNESVYTEKFYNKKGILVHEIKKEGKNASNEGSTKHINLNNVNSVITSETFSSIEERPLSNWLIGFSIPANLHPQFDEINAQIGYRLVGPIYVNAQSDYKFSKPMVGFLINF